MCFRRAERGPLHKMMKTATMISTWNTPLGGFLVCTAPLLNTWGVRYMAESMSQSILSLISWASAGMCRPRSVSLGGRWYAIVLSNQVL